MARKKGKRQGQGKERGELRPPHPPMVGGNVGRGGVRVRGRPCGATTSRLASRALRAKRISPRGSRTPFEGYHLRQDSRENSPTEAGLPKGGTRLEPSLGTDAQCFGAAKRRRGAPHHARTRVMRNRQGVRGAQTPALFALAFALRPCPYPCPSPAILTAVAISGL